MIRRVVCHHPSHLPPPTPSPSPKLGHVLTHTPTPRMHQGVIDGDHGTALGARTSSSTATEVAGLLCLLSATKRLMAPPARDLLCTDPAGSRSVRSSCFPFTWTTPMWPTDTDESSQICLRETVWPGSSVPVGYIGVGHVEGESSEHRSSRGMVDICYYPPRSRSYVPTY